MVTKSSNITLSALFAALTSLGAFIHIPLPFTPVPITLQTFFVYLSGSLLGPVWGTISQIIYLLAGLVGLPVFAGGRSGYVVLLGPTGGYLIGFILCAFTVGHLARHGDNLSNNKLKFAWCLLSLTLGTAIIYLLGVLQLSRWLGVDLIKGVYLGILPFIFGDTIKIIAASYVTIRIRPLLLSRKVN